MSELAVSGCTLQITDSSITATTIQITTTPSTKVLINNKGCYFGSVSVALAGMVKGSTACPTGTITINGTASNILSNANKALQKGDKGSATFTFTDTSSGAETPTLVEVEISDAGQTSVIAS